MNTTQLRKLGVPDECLTNVIMAIQAAAAAGHFKGSETKQLIRSILEKPEDHAEHPHFGAFARSLIEQRNFVPPPPIDYRTWGTDIDGAAHAQMRQSCQVPLARRAALMPDAHVGYGLPIGGVLACENHHNFAWKEEHGGQELIVHRKGATPAGAGVLGVIPGSMADPAFVVRGKGQPESLNSASHGAGRRMSRTKARDMYNWKSVKNDLAKKGVKVLSAGADEVPYVYKRIEEVMSAQQDLVEIVARFDPKIVKMCDDGSAAED
jgi:hypothetical protein